MHPASVGFIQMLVKLHSWCQTVNFVVRFVSLFETGFLVFRSEALCYRIPLIALTACHLPQVTTLYRRVILFRI